MATFAVAVLLAFQSGTPAGSADGNGGCASAGALIEPRQPSVNLANGDTEPSRRLSFRRTATETYASLDREIQLEIQKLESLDQKLAEYKSARFAALSNELNFIEAEEERLRTEKSAIKQRSDLRAVEALHDDQIDNLRKLKLTILAEGREFQDLLKREQNDAGSGASVRRAYTELEESLSALAAQSRTAGDSISGCSGSGITLAPAGRAVAHE